jgi:hypothetical protein
MNRRRTTTAALAVVTVAIGLFTAAAGPAAHATSTRSMVPVTAGLPPIGTVWVSNSAAGTLLEFAPGAHGNVAPVATVGGDSAGLFEPEGIALDNDGRVWVAEAQAPYAIKEFSSHANGNVLPLVTISGTKTGLNEPVGLTVSQSGTIWVTNNAENGDGSVEEFRAGSHGDATPIRVITGAKTKLTDLVGLAVSPDGRHVWVTEHYRNLGAANPAPVVEEFSGTARGNTAPIASITGTDTQLDAAYGVAVGISGTNPIVGDANAGGTMGILAFAPGAHGDAKPKRLISGVTSGVTIPGLISTDALGDAWVPNYFSNVPGFETAQSVARFTSTQNGDVAPKTVITGSATTISHAVGVAVFNTPPLAPLSVKATVTGKGTKRKLRLTWPAPSFTGGGLLGYVVRTKTKHGKWKSLKPTTTRSYLKKRPHKNLSYDVEAFNNLGYSGATKAIKPKV